jgi:hypothetical protein
MSTASSDRDSRRRAVPPADRCVVERQLGRAPRGAWRVEARCSHGFPAVIAVAPRLESGEPFPTTFWLTCPWFAEAVSGLESAGATARWTGALARDAALADAAMAADGAYRAARSALGSGSDPCGAVGTAGQADPLVVKCVHARVAAALAGVRDPVGDGALEELADEGVAAECPDVRCSAYGREPGSG